MDAGLVRCRNCRGPLVYGGSPEEATARAKALALRVLADRLEHGEADSALDDITFAAA
jgi:hypothetical protein